MRSLTIRGPKKDNLHVRFAPVAQLDRALVFGTSAANPQGAKDKAVTADPVSARNTGDNTQAQDRPSEAPSADPRLADVIASWPTLPEAVRAGIAATVKALAGGKGAGK